MKKLLIICAAALAFSCASTVSTKLVNKNLQALPIGIPVLVLNENDPEPTAAALVGVIKIGDSGFTQDCGYDQVIEKAKTAARSAGANLVKITELKKPTTLGSTCYRIKANIYSSNDEQSTALLKARVYAQNKSRLPEDADYAVIYFYRPATGSGALLGYKIKTENDSVIGRLRYGEKFEYKTKTFGVQQFHGDLETKETITIDVQKGQEYFVRAGVTMGVMFGRPELNKVENRVGMKEYREMN